MRLHTDLHIKDDIEIQTHTGERTYAYLILSDGSSEVSLFVYRDGALGRFIKALQELQDGFPAEGQEYREGAKAGLVLVND